MAAEKTGRLYHSSVVAAAAADGHWNVWIEFVDPVSGDVLRTGIETHQTTEADLHHWASVLSDVYLQGALARAAESPRETGIHRRLAARAALSARQDGRALDPFELFAHGEHVLRRELQLFTRTVLRAIVITYGLNPAALDLSRFTKVQLVTFIVTAVEAQHGRRRT